MIRKINNICKVTFYPLSNLSSEINRPGLDSVSFTGTGISLEVTSATLTEEDMGGAECVQSFSALVTDTSKNTSEVIFGICAVFGILGLTLSTGEERVVGSTEFPIALQYGLEGTPLHYKLAFKRNTPDRAKFRVL